MQSKKTIEVEVRSFLTEAQFKKLLHYFKKEAKFLGKDDQVTFYFDCPEDLRIQKNNKFSKIWLKKGALHDTTREEIEVKTNLDDFDTLEKLFLALGYKVEIKWFRRRYTFKWGDIDLTLDFTKGYGYIIELEKMSDKAHQAQTASYLKAKMAKLNIPITPKEKFDQKYQYYKQNWQKLVA